MSDRFKKTGPLALSIGVIAFLWSEFVLNFNLVTPLDDELALRSAASTLARAAGGVLRPLTVVRRDEIVVVRALDELDPRTLTEPIADAQRNLARSGVGLAVGVSTAFETTAGLPEAYQEACIAMQSVRPGGGVTALAD